MKLPHVLRAEFGAVFQTRSVPGMGDFTELFSLLRNTEQKTVQSLNARAFRRAVRRSRSTSRRSF